MVCYAPRPGATGQFTTDVGDREVVVAPVDGTTSLFATGVVPW